MPHRFVVSRAETADRISTASVSEEALRGLSDKEARALVIFLQTELMNRAMEKMRNTSSEDLISAILDANDELANYPDAPKN